MIQLSELRLIDIRSPEKQVEVQISDDGKRLWVNVDGICLLRIQDMPEPPAIVQVD